MPALNHFDIAFFLQHHWQKTPCLIRQALPPDLFPLTPEELAGLACEEDIESRLITGCADFSYQLQHGPFDEAVFNALPANNWTLLVQAVDHVVADVASLLDYFRFIPNWRIDDIMVSYAPAGGSTGAHYDNYDVFLIQGRGTRNWQIADPVGDAPALLPHDELRLLKDFSATDEWELQPGDVLYLPPRYAHWGVSTSQDCMTYSVGFRAPSVAELLSGYCDHLIDSLTEVHRYTDPDLQLHPNPGLISPAAIDRVTQLFTEQLNNRSQLARWFARSMTQPKHLWVEDARCKLDRRSLRRKLLEQRSVLRNPGSRFAYLEIDDDVLLYVDGEEYPLPRQQLGLVQSLCSGEINPQSIEAAIASAPAADLLLALFRQGALYFAHDNRN